MGFGEGEGAVFGDVDGLGGWDGGVLCLCIIRYVSGSAGGWVCTRVA